MKPFVRYAIIAALSLAFTAISVALVPREARAVATSYVWTQVKTLKSTVASIITTNRSQATSISSLKGRMTGFEATGTVLSARMSSLESSNTSMFDMFGNLSDAFAVLTGRLTAVEASQAALASRIEAIEGGAGQNDFWPATEATVTASVHAYSDTADPSGASSGFEPRVSVLLTDTATDISTKFAPDYMWITVNGRKYPQWEHPAYSPEGLPSGSPVMVEYWIDRYGHRIHGSKIVTDWAWIIY